MIKTIIIVSFTFLLANIFAQEIKEQKNQKLNNTLSPQASSNAFAKFKSLSNTLLHISNQIDESGNEFGVMNFKSASDEPSEPDSVKNRLWKDPDEDLTYGGNIKALGDIIVDNKVTTNTISIKSGAGPNKVLTSIGTNGLASWQTLAASGSINGLSDGKAETNTGSVYLGEGAGTNDDSPGISDPSNNTALGINALNKNGLVASQRGEKNTAIGFEALKNMDNNNGNNNTALGYQAHLWNNDGHENTALGAQAMVNYSGGFGNTVVGYQALKGSASGRLGNYNTVIGHNALPDLATTSTSGDAGSYNVAIGYEAAKGHTNIKEELFIQNHKASGSSPADPLIWGDFNFRKVQLFVRNHSTTNKFWVNNSAGGTSAWSSSSDKRLKKNISTIPNALEKIKKLRGVNFEWKQPETHRAGLQMGFIAQESVDVIPEVVDSKSAYMSMEYAPITALLVEAVKEQQKIIDQQNSRINSQEERLSKLESLLDGKRFTSIKK